MDNRLDPDEAKAFRQAIKLAYGPAWVRLAPYIFGRSRHTIQGWMYGHRRVPRSAWKLLYRRWDVILDQHHTQKAVKIKQADRELRDRVDSLRALQPLLRARLGIPEPRRKPGSGGRREPRQEVPAALSADQPYKLRRG